MRNKKKVKFELPKVYQMDTFPASIDFPIPGFLKKYIPGNEKTLAIKSRESGEWYHEFIDKCIDACGKKYLPIYRMSDGEFLFLLGEQPMDIRLQLIKKIKYKLGDLKAKLFLNRGIVARTQGHYHSGEYSSDEWEKARFEQPLLIKKISEKGILAIHLNYVPEPFGERYWPKLDNWFDKHRILINDNNYYPFYFVYAMLTGARRGELLNNRRILVVNGAQGKKKQQIIDGLKREGVSEVHWCSISLKRSLYDIINMKPYIGKIDLALIGAGIGKSAILTQMEPLNVPCIDAGFVFEVWADPKNKWERSYCASDDDYAEVENGNTI